MVVTCIGELSNGGAKIRAKASRAVSSPWSGGWRRPKFFVEIDPDGNFAFGPDDGQRTPDAVDVIQAAEMLLANTPRAKGKVFEVVTSFGTRYACLGRYRLGLEPCGGPYSHLTMSWRHDAIPCHIAATLLDRVRSW